MSDQEKATEQTPEEVSTMLTLRQPVSPDVVNLLGKEIISEFEDIVYRPILIEADKLVMTGESTLEGMMDIMAQLPDFTELEKDLAELVEKTANYIDTQKMNALMQRSFDKDGNLTESEGNRMFKLINHIYRLTNSQHLPVESLRNNYLNRFEDNLLGVIFAMVSARLDEAQASAFAGLYEQMFETAHDTRGYGASIAVLGDIALTHERLPGDYSENLAALLAGVPDRSLKDFRDENEILTLELSSIAFFRKTEAYEKTFGDVRVRLLPEISEYGGKDSKLFRVAEVRIIFDPLSNPENPDALGKDKRGNIRVARNTEPGMVDVSIARGTGQICCGNTLISCAHLVEPSDPKQYEKFRNLILKTALEYFESKENDLEDSTQFSAEEQENRARKRKYEADERRQHKEAEQKKIVDEMDRAGKDNAELLKTEALRKDEEIRLAEEARDTLKKALKEKKDEDARRDASVALHDVPLSDIVHVMKNMNALVWRQKGDHVTFTSSLNNESIPVVDKHGENLSSAAIRKLCDKLGISPIEVLAKYHHKKIKEDTEEASSDSVVAVGEKTPEKKKDKKPSQSPEEKRTSFIVEQAKLSAQREKEVIRLRTLGNVIEADRLQEQDVYENELAIVCWNLSGEKISRVAEILQMFDFLECKENGGSNHIEVTNTISNASYTLINLPGKKLSPEAVRRMIELLGLRPAQILEKFNAPR